MRINSNSLLEIQSKLGDFEIGCGVYPIDDIGNINKPYQYIRFGYWSSVDVSVLNSLVHDNITFEEEIVDETEYGFPLYAYKYKSKF